MRDISPKDLDRLRALASHQAELASGDRMRDLYADWARHGRFEKGARPMFTVELWTFAGEVIPPLLCCEGEKARRLEAMLLGNTIPFEMFKDDTPVRGYLPVPLKKRFVPFGLPVRKSEADDSGAAGVGHRFEAYLHDLEEDWHLLGKSAWSFDEAATQAEIDALNELFGDLLPARRSGETLMVGPAEDIIHLIGMEDLYVAMYDAPDRVHEMMDRLLDDYAESLDEMEKRGLILPTAGDEALPQGSYCFTDSLPSAGSGLETRQVWGYMDAEEMNDVSPEMYRAFITDHYRRIAQRFGALSFGCCEAIHRVWAAAWRRCRTCARCPSPPGATSGSWAIGCAAGTSCTSENPRPTCWASAAAFMRTRCAHTSARPPKPPAAADWRSRSATCTFSTDRPPRCRAMYSWCARRLTGTGGRDDGPVPYGRL
jgi:hypothetical protein